MITAFDPNNLLEILSLEHNKSYEPVDKINLLTPHYPKLLDFERPWIAWDGEVIKHDSRFWRASRPPIAMLTTHKTKVPDPYAVHRIFYPHHFMMTIKTNTKLGRIRPVSFTKARPFLADALLGQPRYHRWLTLEFLRSQQLLDRCLVNFIDGQFEDMDRLAWHKGSWPTFEPAAPYRSPALASFDEKGIDDEIKKNHRWSSIDIYPQFGAWTSQVLPNDIYEASYISVITETSYNDDDFFLTEKTAKALLAGRIFIALGPINILRQIRSLGFLTFDGLFDESYDDFTLIHERVNAAMELLGELSKTNLDLLYEKAAPILYHNQAVMKSGLLCAKARGFIEGLAA